MLRGNLTITDDKVFYKLASADFNKRAKTNTENYLQQLQPKISQLIYQALSDSPTVHSLLSGSLKHDFGLYGNVAATTLINIVKHLSENIKISIKKGSSKTSISTIVIDILPSSFEKVAKLPVGYFLSDKGRAVPWLEWLLTKGTQVVVGDFWMYEPAVGKTRSTGPKVMKKIGKTPRQGFRVDPAHAGTSDNNFITRAIDPVADKIILMVATEFIRST